MGFVADDDSRFAVLDAGVLEAVRQTEKWLNAGCKKALDDALAKIPAIAREEVRPCFDALAAEIPPAVVRGLYEICKEISDIREMQLYLNVPRGRRKILQ